MTRGIQRLVLRPSTERRLSFLCRAESSPHNIAFGVLVSAKKRRVAKRREGETLREEEVRILILPGTVVASARDYERVETHEK